MPEQLSSAVTYDLVDEVAVVRLDDGKANAIGHEAITAIDTALERAENEAKAVLVVGRDGKFCAGFDLGVMTSGDDDAVRGLLGAGAELTLRMYLHPQPVVIASTGHALALGALFLMAADLRIGTEGPYKIGMNEVTIGLPLPRWASALAQDRLSRRHVQLATQHGRIHDPAGAVAAGYLDEIVEADSLERVAHDAAAAAAGAVHPGAFETTRRYMRTATADAIRAGLALDLLDFTVNT